MKKHYPYLLLATGTLAGLYLSSLYNYLLFHTIAELFSIIIACGIFMITWNSRRFIHNNYVLFIGMAYLFVGGLDLVHTLSFKGMAIFKGYGTNLATQFWIAARYMESLSLLIAPLLFRRRLRPRLILLGYSAGFLLILLSIFSWEIFPVCFVEGTGLTPFKKISEYVISFILFASVGLLFKSRGEFDWTVLRWVIGSVALTVASELCFTVYTDAYGLSNLIGHYFKILSFYFIYKAIIETGLSKPYDLLFRNVKQSEERLRLFIEHAPAAVAMFDRDMRYISASRRFLSDYRVSLPDIIGRSHYELFPDLPERWKEIHRRCLAGAIEKCEEDPFPREDGTLDWVRWEIHPWRAASGEIGGIILFSEVITDRKRAEDAQRLSEEKFAKAFGINPAAIAMTRLEDGVFLEVNDTWVALVGYSREEATGHSAREMHIWPATEASSRFVTELQKKGTLRGWEQEFRKKSGEVFVAQLSAQVLTLRGEKVILSTLVDITERRRAEEALRQSDQRFRLALRNAPVSVAVQDRDLRYIWAYNQKTALPEGIVGKLDEDIFTPEEAAGLKVLKQRVLDENVECHEQMWFDRPGGRIFLDVYWEPIRDENGQVTGVGSVTVNLTPTKLAEEALKKAHGELRDYAERLEAANKELESFSYSVSHDLRAPLRAIHGFSNILLQDYGPQFDKEGRRLLGVIQSNASKMGQLIDDLLTLSRLGRIAMQVRRLDTAKLALRVSEELKAMNTERVLRITLKDMPSAAADETLLGQVFRNLIGNAIKFTRMKEIGVIEIGGYENGEEHAYYIKDNGAGFDMKYHDQLFGVFQRLHTTDEFEGTGVGLAIVHRIISRHGGRVWAEGEVGKGATFYFALPRLNY